jgi:hypothetical protein
MSRKRSKKKTSASPKAAKNARPTRPVPQPVNVVDGIPDHAETRSRWRLPILLLIFAAWLGFLLYCLLAGGTGS